MEPLPETTAMRRGWASMGALLRALSCLLRWQHRCCAAICTTFFAQPSPRAASPSHLQFAPPSPSPSHLQFAPPSPSPGKFSTFRPTWAHGDVGPRRCGPTWASHHRQGPAQPEVLGQLPQLHAAAAGRAGPAAGPHGLDPDSAAAGRGGALVGHGGRGGRDRLGAAAEAAACAPEGAAGRADRPRPAGFPVRAPTAIQASRAWSGLLPLSTAWGDGIPERRGRD